MSKLVPPHGSGSLRPLLAPASERAGEIERAKSLKKIPLTRREISDLFMLGMGAYTPLGGFMGEADWRGSCTDMQLSSGVFWPVPITLSADPDVAGNLREGDDAALVDGDSGVILGVIAVREKYKIDKQFECSHVYRTTDTAHPG